MNVEAKTSQRTPTEIILEWERPARDADGGGDGDGFGEIIKYEIEVSENDSTTWEALATVTVKAACDGNGLLVHARRAAARPDQALPGAHDKQGCAGRLKSDWS